LVTNRIDILQPRNRVKIIPGELFTFILNGVIPNKRNLVNASTIEPIFLQVLKDEYTVARQQEAY
jgi:hypothetical protein